MKQMAKLWLYRIIGGLAIACGAIGVVLPGIPTVPFLLVALWAFTQLFATDTTLAAKPSDLWPAPT